jgi:putative transcriptional regulator
MRDTAHKSEALAAIHETIGGLYEAELINKKTRRDFDASCLTPVAQISGSDIKQLRERENVSQSIFAIYLSVSKNLISGGPILRLLAIVQK